MWWAFYVATFVLLLACASAADEHQWRRRGIGAVASATADYAKDSFIVGSTKGVIASISIEDGTERMATQSVQVVLFSLPYWMDQLD
jgi:hypothetical protein